AILDHNKATGMNAVYLQVRSQADAMYPSTLEPWSYYLTNNQGTAPNPAWDPLQFAIDETRKRGMEFHAWVNPYRAVATLANAGNNAQYAPTHVSRTHPEWLLTVGTVQIMNPGLPAVRDHVTSVIMDIVSRYDIDGLHFDDYFYPSGTSGDDAAYNADPRGFPATTAGRADWRRDNINMLISRVGENIRTAKPWVKFGISPSGIYRSSTDPAVGSPTSAGALQHYSAMFADSRKWLQQGWVDYLIPQVYWYMGQAGSDYSLLVPWWNMNAYDRHMYIGIADYKMNTAGWLNPREVANQIALNRSQTNVSGQVHFRHAFLQTNPLGYRTDLMNTVYNKPALLPAMLWKDHASPAAPTAVASTVNADGSVALSWTWPEDSRNNEFDKARRYAVYRSDSANVDIENADNLVGLTNAGETTYIDRTAPAGSYFYYAVTALNRVHHESVPGNTVSNDAVPPTVVTRSATQTLVGGTASIGAADVDGGSTDNWGIASLAVSKSAFTCADVGANQVTLSMTDKAGNTASAPATVNIVGAVPAPAVAVSRTDGTATGQGANVIVLGYGAQSLNLTANDGTAGSTSTYAWAPAAGLSASGAAAQFVASAAGTFNFTVQAQNQYGCVAPAAVSVTVIDAVCQGDKVNVCQKTGNGAGHQVCVSPNAVPAKLKQGSTLGMCQ
ncbi:MAG TPA: family 10 glycosylhydrolase, partial [Burkholderiaceae bacterium]